MPLAILIAVGVFVVSVLGAEITTERRGAGYVACAGTQLVAAGMLTGRGDVTAITVVAATFGLLILAFRLSAANQEAERLLVELAAGQQERERAAGLAERQHLAREMHDVLAHSISGLMLHLEGARMLAAADPTDPRLPAAPDRAHHLGRAGLEEARRAIGMLRDDELPGPDRPAELADRFERDHAVPCRFTVNGSDQPLGSQARLELYRVAQEALTNIAKHARPERVELHLAYAPGAVRRTVTDVGAPPTGADLGADTGGYGLTGMRERAELLGGTLVTTADQDGFRVDLAVPA